MKISGIYAIVHVGSGGAYVGSARHIFKRWGEHAGLLNSGGHHAPALLDLWFLDGPAAFTFVILEQCPPDILTERERYWIDQFAVILNASRSVRPHTDAWRAAVSATKMGHSVSQATRAKLSVASTLCWADSEKRAEMTAAQRAGWANKPEVRAWRSAATKAWQASRDPEEKRAALSHASRVRWARPIT